jgi:uncharacterized protein YtpQ (UPF0354 family)
MRAQVTQKSFKFAEKHGCPFFFVSASDGTNVVRIFNEAILQGAQPDTQLAIHRELEASCQRCNTKLSVQVLGVVLDVKP